MVEEGPSAPSVLQLPLLPEQGAQDESALVAEMNEWHEAINDLLDADAPSAQGVQEVHVGELASSMASWCKDAGSDAATSLAKRATSILPKSTSGAGLRRKGSGAPGEARGAAKGAAATRRADAGGWLSATIASTVSLLTRSPGKADKLGRQRAMRDGDGLGERGERGERLRDGRAAADGSLRRQRSDLGPRPASSSERPKSDRDLRVRRSQSDLDGGK